MAERKTVSGGKSSRDADPPLQGPALPDPQEHRHLPHRLQRRRLDVRGSEGKEGPICGATQEPDLFRTQKNRERIGSGLTLDSARPELFSGSVRNCKSRARARISGDSPKCPKTEGLCGGEE